MRCTDCENTVPLSGGQWPKYALPDLSLIADETRPQVVGSKQEREPLCRPCWEKATEQCQEHKRIPEPNGVRGCYGALFTCPSCERRVCAGYGGAPDPRCDTCISEPVDD